MSDSEETRPAPQYYNFTIQRKRLYDLDPVAAGFSAWSDRLSRDLVEKMAACHSGWMAMLDEVAKMILAAGHEPLDCLVEHCHYSDRTVRTLKVDGKPVFEVTTTWSPMVDYKYTITHTPRFIAWPTAPQVRASSEAGDP